MAGRKHFFSVTWGRPQAYDTDLHFHELSHRLWWLITLRWIVAVGFVLGAVVIALQLLPVKIDYRFLIAVAVFLALTNLIIIPLTRFYTEKSSDLSGIRIMVVVQTLTDFMALSLSTYALGGVETPILVLFLGEIIVLTLFCRRLTSFLMTFVGAFFAVLPMLLEYLGVVPTLSIFNNPFKASLNSAWHFTGMYIAGITLTFGFFWYLVSEIATSLRLREHQLEQAYEKLTHLDREKTQATLRATHELKAPLAAINSYVYAVRDGYAGDVSDKARQVLQRIGDRSDYLMKKIVDIIHLSNLKTLVLKQAELSRLDLTGLLAKEVGEAQMIGKPRNIRIINHADTAPSYYICGSLEHLHTLISNLLQNAVNYSDDDSRVEVSLQGKHDRVTLSVQDHGIGIPEENLGRIFDEHFRSNNAVAHNPSGTGLGLPIVKETARLHHAVLRVSSELKEGTRFNVTFRLIQPKPTAGAHYAQSSHHR